MNAAYETHPASAELFEDPVMRDHLADGLGGSGHWRKW
jgi:hypothetical protein